LLIDQDLESSAEEEINDIRGRMIKAAEADAAAHDQGQPAFHKIKMLPEVTAILNRNTHMQSLTDPDINLLEAVRFFLEPLNDGALPAYNIQRDLFASISKLPINKESLIASGIGKVTLFYTKSKKVEIHIKRQAEKLIQEWTRPMLQKSDDHTKKVYQKATYDPLKKDTQVPDLVQKVKMSAPGEKKNNRARLYKGVTGYTIVPESRIIVPNR
jgi:transcription factor SPN1